jgi:hypothetical protein
MFSFGIFEFQGYFAIKLCTNELRIPVQDDPACAGQPAFAYLLVWGPLSGEVNCHYYFVTPLALIPVVVAPLSADIPSIRRRED